MVIINIIESQRSVFFFEENMYPIQIFDRLLLYITTVAEWLQPLHF